MLKLLKDEQNGKLVWDVVDQQTGEVLTDKYRINVKGKEAYLISAEKYKVETVKDLTFHVFHIYNIETKEFDCISVIPPTTLKTFLQNLQDSDVKFGLIGRIIEQKPIKNGKGRFYYDFWRSRVTMDVAEKLKGSQYNECMVMEDVTTADDLKGVIF